MSIARWLRVCLTLAPLALISVILVGLLDAECTYTVPSDTECAVEEIQCGVLSGYNKDKECADRKKRDNTEEGQFGCESASESYTDCVTDPDNQADCYTEWDCYVKSPGVCGYNVDTGSLKPANITKSDPC